MSREYLDPELTSQCFMGENMKFSFTLQMTAVMGLQIQISKESYHLFRVNKVFHIKMMAV